MSEFTQIPSIESLLESKAFEKLTKAHGRDLVLRAMRATVNEIRENIKKGGKSESDAELASNVGKRIEAWTKPTLLPVINASGVILHTNLGRAPLCDEAVNAIVETASSYCTLEYNLTKGERGNREVHAAELLKLITGAESALVVNNNAAAVLLVLSALAKGKRVDHLALPIGGNRRGFRCRR